MTHYLVVRKKKMGIKQEEFEAYNFVSKMVPRADGKINNYVPYWCGWALREAFEAGFNYCKQNIEKGNKCMVFYIYFS